MKGAAFEREISRRLSLWVTNGERDDIFWRTHGSGARATVRRKRAKETYGQDGDICAVHPLGEPFCKTWVVSLKTGYCSREYFCALDLLDSPRRTKHLLLSWWREVEELAKRTGRKPLLIFRRNRRLPVVALPLEVAAPRKLVVMAGNVGFCIVPFEDLGTVLCTNSRACGT